MKKIVKKLALNKQTMALLDDNNMRFIQGGKVKTQVCNTDWTCVPGGSGICTQGCSIPCVSIEISPVCTSACTSFEGSLLNLCSGISHCQ